MRSELTPRAVPIDLDDTILGVRWLRRPSVGSSEPEVTSRLTSEELDEIFDYGYYVRLVDETFERVGIP